MVTENTKKITVSAAVAHTSTTSSIENHVGILTDQNIPHMNHVLAHPPQRVSEVSWVLETFLVVCAGERQSAVPEHDAGLLQCLPIEGVVLSDVVDGERFYFWFFDISHLGKKNVVI